MTKITRIPLLLIFSITLAFLSCNTVSTSISEGAFTVRKVAVLKFEVENGKDWEDDFTGAFMHHLMRHTKWQIVERQHLDKVFQEQKFSQSGIVDQKTAQELGRILGVDTLVIGEGKAKFYIRNDGSSERELVERFSVRVINVQNGAIVIKARKVPGIDWNGATIAKLILGMGLIWSKEDILIDTNMYDYVAKTMARDVGKALTKMDKLKK